MHADRREPSSLAFSERRDPQSYFPMDLRTLRVDATVGFDLYIRVRGEFVLYRHQDLPFDVETLVSLRANGIDTLYVSEQSAEPLAEYYEQHLSSIVSDDRVPLPQRARSVVHVAQGIARSVLRNPDGQTMRRASRVVHELASLAVGQPGAVARLIHLVGSGTTFESHSVNTALFAVAMGELAPDPSLEMVTSLAAAGLFHDIGLGMVQTEILQKPGPLDSDERRLVREHPVTGEQILRQCGDFPDEVLLAVRWHHERLDGSGYPDGLRGRAIPWTARAIAIAEVFDALTSDQPYRERIPPVEAVRMMYFEMSGQLDAVLIRRFIPKLLTNGGDAEALLIDQVSGEPPAG